MPNWCNNNLRLEHNDSKMIDRFVKAFTEGRAMDEFLPCPQELKDTTAPYRGENSDALIEKYGAADWYDWSIKNWGTKWDIGGEGLGIDRVDDCTVECSFDSAWAPPVEFYHHMVNLGFIVEAMYDEPGMAFCGTVETSDGELYDSFYEYSGMSSDEVEDMLPPELNESFCISENIAQWEEEENDE